MYAARALKLLNRVEEAIDKYCECYLHLLSQKDVSKVRAQVLHNAVTISLEHGKNLNHSYYFVTFIACI